MEEDIKILERIRDNVNGEIQFEDDYQVRELEQKQFDALNLAINHLRKTKLIHSNYIPKSKVREKMSEVIKPNEIEKKYIWYKDIREGKLQVLRELLEEE